MIFCNNKTKCQAEYNGKCCIKNFGNDAIVGGIYYKVDKSILIKIII